MEEHIILIVGLYFSCQGEVGLCRHPVQLSQQVPGWLQSGESRWWEAGSEQCWCSFPLAFAEGVELDVARDDLARADHPLVAISEIFPLGCSLQAQRKYRLLLCASSPGSRAAGRTVCSWKGMYLFLFFFFNTTPGCSLCGTWEAQSSCF